MPIRRVVTALLAASLLLAGAPASWAQPAPPPRLDDLGPAKPWTYDVGRALVALSVLVLLALAVGYLVKAREFRANLRRGGSK